MSDNKENKESKGNKGLIIILIITLLIVVALAGFFAYFMFFKNGASTSASASASKSTSVEEKTVSMDEFIINLTDNKYIKLNIALACTDTNVEKEIPNKIEQIRNEVNVLIRTKSSADFSGIGLDKIKQELIDKINAKLDSGKITNIYFHEIIIQ